MPDARSAARVCPWQLVPGDVVFINVGDKVPADVRLIKLKTTSLRTDEGALTGEPPGSPCSVASGA